jgi:hypothetical protein
MRPESLDESADVGFLVGRIVQSIAVSFQFDLVVGGDSDRVVVTLTRFFYRAPGGLEHELDANSDRAGLGPALDLFGAEIAAATIDRGSLRLRFGDASEIKAPPLEAYESWQVSGPGTALIVCAPGGKLAIWS